VPEFGLARDESRTLAPKSLGEAILGPVFLNNLAAWGAFHGILKRARAGLDEF
jgi:hypothetical protein